MSNFPDYAGPLTETILLGNLAVWKRGRVEWDPKNLKPLNDPSLEQDRAPRVPRRVRSVERRERSSDSCARFAGTRCPRASCRRLGLSIDNLPRRGGGPSGGGPIESAAGGRPEREARPRGRAIGPPRTARARRHASAVEAISGGLGPIRPVRPRRRTIGPEIGRLVRRILRPAARLAEFAPPFVPRRDAKLGREIQPFQLRLHFVRRQAEQPFALVSCRTCSAKNLPTRPGSTFGLQRVADPSPELARSSPPTGKPSSRWACAPGSIDSTSRSRTSLLSSSFAHKLAGAGSSFTAPTFESTARGRCRRAAVSLVSSSAWRSSAIASTHCAASPRLRSIVAATPARAPAARIAERDRPARRSAGPASPRAALPVARQ